MSGDRPRSTRLLGAVLVLGLLAACSNRADEGTGTTTAPTVAPTEAPATTTAGAPTTDGGAETTAPPATEPPGVMFGDLPSPCGPGDATIAEGQNGGDTLRLATGTDKGADVAPGLNAEMYDAAVAFAGWCNEQGGIGGLPVEIIDADAKLFGVPSAMETICADAFAMVGGGWAFDDQQFPRFHECGMIDVAGYTVTTAKSMSNGMVSPLPNRSDVKPGLWWKWVKDNHPDAIGRTGWVYTDITAAALNDQSYAEIVDQLGGFEVVERIPHNPIGEPNWAPFAQRMKDSDVQVLSFIGAPEFLAQMLRSMQDIDYRPEVVVLETNHYADVLINQAGDAAEGAVARTAFVPLDERDRSPALDDYLTMMATHNPDGKIANLALQSTSSFLLFATAAKACIEANDGVLDRECVLAEVSTITEWTAGGLHAPSNLAENLPSSCTALVQVQDGEWTRLWPEIGSADDAGNGFACDDSTLFTMTGDYGDVNAGVDPNR